MKIVFAPDSFKGSMSASQVISSMEKGFKKVFHDLVPIHLPMADGGEGTKDSLVISNKGYFEEVTIPSLTGKNVLAQIGVIQGGKTLVIDSASAVGLTLAKDNERNPLKTNSFGLGILLKKALDLKPERIILGLGGSGTNDGGTGAFMALGGKILDKYNKPISLGGSGLKEVYKIDSSCLDKRLMDVDLIGAFDVNNPLTGPKGASFVYGPQKGANTAMVLELEEGMENYRKVLNQYIGYDINDINGSGAAGGLGASIIALLKGQLLPGIDVVLNYTNFLNRVKDANLIITGEGKLDYQTGFGKAPLGVARLANKLSIPVISINGFIQARNNELKDMGFNSVFSISPGPISLEDSMVNGSIYMEDFCENLANIISLKFNCL